MNLKYEYSYLILAPENEDIDDFVNAYNKKYYDISNALDDIFYKNGGVVIEVVSKAVKVNRYYLMRSYVQNSI